MPYPPRPVKRRRGARVLVVAGDEVLLVRDTDPGVPGSSWWVLPGGGADEGEDAAAAAIRELYEETGLRTEQVTGPIAQRVVTHGYSDRILIQHELFFRVDVSRFDPVPAGLSQSERRRQITTRWTPLSQLASYTTWPHDLQRLLEATPERPLLWGEVEESTVPVGGEHEKQGYPDQVDQAQRPVEASRCFGGEDPQRQDCQRRDEQPPGSRVCGEGADGEG